MIGGWNLRSTSGEIATYCALCAVAGFVAGIVSAVMLDRDR